jgi:hypothetical protein
MRELADMLEVGQRVKLKRREKRRSRTPKRSMRKVQLSNFPNSGKVPRYSDDERDKELQIVKETQRRRKVLQTARRIENPHRKFPFSSNPSTWQLTSMHFRKLPCGQCSSLSGKERYRRSKLQRNRLLTKKKTSLRINGSTFRVERRGGSEVGATSSR